MLLAHGETEQTRELVFGDVSDLVVGHRPTEATRRLPVTWWSAPEPACRQTAELFSVEPAGVIDELAGPDAGRWRGRSLAEVMADEPAALQRWLVDPFASPHDGESLAALVERIGRVLDGAVPIGKAQPPRWTEEGATLVVAPLVARAAVVHALGAPPASIFHVDVAPSGTVRLGQQGGRWRLSGLERADRG
ncbi:MAG: histidine phosphatase family protein [Terracoccus sp.]